MEPLDLSWSDEQLEHEIVQHVPEPLEFVCEWREDHWSARIESGGEALHAAAHVDRRTALYSVYGFLWLREQTPPIPGSAWDPNGARPSIASVSRYVQSMVAEPEDLDPEQIAAVYGIPNDARRAEPKKG